MLAAVAVALLAGIAAEGLVPSLSARSFGGFHLVFGSLALFGILASATGVGFLARGDYRGLTRAGDLVPAFFTSERSQLGDFAVLWVNGVADNLRVDLSSPSGETALTYSSRRANGGQRYLESVVASVIARRTEQGGRLLAPLGVRYVVVRSGAARDVERAFERQVDMRFSQRFRGSEIVANDAWLPIAGGVSSLRWVSASRAAAESTAAAVAGAPPDPGRSGALRRREPGRFEGDIAPTARSLLVAQEFSGRWRATSGTASIAPARSFGWATAFQITGSGARHLDVRWHGHGVHRVAILAEFLALLAIGAAWSRRAARERGER
jgi:hypothetical protein